MSNSSNPRHVYVDTQYLHAFIFPNTGRRNDEDYIASLQFNEILYSRDPQIILKIPFIVMGETINNIHRRVVSETDRSDIIRKLLNVMAEERVDLAPPTSDCFKLSINLLEADRDLDDTDSLIVSQALCDELSSHLIIKDAAVIDSAAIQKKNTELHENGFRPRRLKITPEYISI
jgi:hypothetical protein